MKVECTESIGDEWFIVGNIYDLSMPEREISDVKDFVWSPVSRDGLWKIIGYNEYIAVFKEV